MVYYPSRSASGFLHGMLLQQPKKKGGVAVISVSLFTEKWRFVMINVRTGELHVYKIPSSQKINSNTRHVTDVTSYCPNHEFQFQQCGDLYLIVRTTNWTLQASNRGGNGSSFTLRWEEEEEEEEQQQDQDHHDEDMPLPSMKRSHSDSNIHQHKHNNHHQEDDSPILKQGKTSAIARARSDETNDSSIGATTSTQTVFTTATAVTAAVTKERSICLKCPYGGNEKAVYIKAATELGCLIVKPSRRRPLEDGGDGVGHYVSASASGSGGVRKKVWRYRQRGQQPLDFQAMSIAIGTSRHGLGYSNSLNTPRGNRRRRAGSIEAAIDNERVKEFLVMPAYAYPVRWMTKRELQSEVEHKSTVFHSVITANNKHQEYPPNTDIMGACKLPKDTSSISPVASTSSTAASSRKHLHESLEYSNRDPGVIGWMEVEVLSCIGLPHADVLAKTDAMVYLVCGSHVFQTDTIFNANSPMWPRKSKRAVRFPLKHAYARLYCGVFDNFDQRHGGQGGVFAGRVSLDVAALRPNSLYDVTLPLRYTTQMHATDPRPRGAIRFRCRLHWDNERCAVLSYLPSCTTRSSEAIEETNKTTVTIPCDDRNMFRCVALTVHGTDMNGRFSLPMFKQTMKEVRLYCSYFATLVKETMTHLHEWTNPFISCYVFGGWMHCVYRNSMALAYPYLTGYLILCMLENYARFVLHKSFYAGFSPLTINELFRALVSNSSLDKRHLKPWGQSKKEEESATKHTPVAGANRSGSLGTTAPSPYQPRGQFAADLLLAPLGFLQRMPRYEASSFVSVMKHQDFPASDPAKHPKREVRHSAANGVVGGGHGVGKLNKRLKSSHLYGLKREAM
jgi:hypothetical protein